MQVFNERAAATVDNIIRFIFVFFLLLWTVNQGQILPADSLCGSYGRNTSGDLYGCSVQDFRRVAISARNISNDSLKVYRQTVAFDAFTDPTDDQMPQSILDNADTSKFILLSAGAWVLTGPLSTYIDSTISVSMDSCHIYRVCRINGAEIGRAIVKVRDPQIWYSYQAINDSMEQMVRDYPDYANMEQIGNTVLGKPIYGIKIGKGTRCIGLIGAVHGSESGPEIIVYALERFLSSQRGLLDSISLVAIPDGNWDQRQKNCLGYPYFIYTNAAIPYGVNLNRNFPSPHWSECCDALDGWYRGPSPNSEPETKAIMGFLNTARPSMILSYHAVGPLVGGELHAGQPDGDDTYIQAADEWAHAWDSNVGLSFGSFPGGTLSTWAKYALGVPAYEVEGNYEEAMKDQFSLSTLQKCQQEHYQRILNAARYLRNWNEPDSTPPTDVTMDSPLVSDQTITLSWNAATDAESGIENYQIYRGSIADPTTLLITVGNVLTYQDQTNIENAVFHYRVKAVNGAGVASLVFSNDVTAATAPDTIKPVVAAIYALTNSVRISFSEKVDQVSAETIGNYTINPGIQITAASCQADQKTVVLTVSTLSIGTAYSLHIGGIRDQAAIQNTMNPLDTAFSLSGHAAISITADDIYDLYFNGQLVGSNSDWHNVEKYSVYLQTGKNVISVKGVDLGAPGGLLAEIVLDSNAFRSGTGTAWKTSTQEQAAWTTTGFDDAAWSSAIVIGDNGIDPWGNVGMPEGTTAQWIWSTGSPETVYFRYVFDVSDITDNEPGVMKPENLDLAVSPNPFNPTAYISYYLPQKTVVSLALYSLQGKLVRELVGGMVSAGRHSVLVDAGRLASGVYVCELKSGAAAKRLKLVLMR